MGGSSQPTTQYVKSEQSNLPEYARPYFEGMMQRSQSLLTQPYQTYDQDRIAGFTPEQQQVQQDILGQRTPGEFGSAGTLATAAGLGSLQAANYRPGQFNPQQVQGQQFGAPGMQAAQTGFDPNLNFFQMQSPEQFGSQQAQQYMSPFIEQALEPQLREAVTDARRAQINQDLGAARQGTYGGSRQLLASMERERNLGQQMGDIRARGMEAAFGQAQQQFERDRAAGMTSQQANLQAALGVQQLGTQTGLQSALANLDADSQSRVQNLAAQLQTQGLNADQALRAALANQQTDLEGQRLGEQSRQFGAQQGLAALGQAGQMGQTLTNIGSARSQADQARLGLQSQTAAQQQGLNQQFLDTAYQDFLRQRDFPLEMLQQYSSLLRGVPVAPSSTQTTYAPAPSMASQLMGAGLGGLSLANMFGGR
jgi:hypothetical protein